MILGAADALIVPTIPTTLSERTLDQLTSFLYEHPPATMAYQRLWADIAARIWT